jgi:hypothetical protein
MGIQTSWHEVREVCFRVKEVWVCVGITTNWLSQRGLLGRAGYFKQERAPKVLLTTCYKPTGVMYMFMADIIDMLPNATFHKRRVRPLPSLPQCPIFGPVSISQSGIWHPMHH